MVVAWFAEYACNLYKSHPENGDLKLLAKCARLPLQVNRSLRAFLKKNYASPGPKPTCCQVQHGGMVQCVRAAGEIHLQE